MCVPPGKRLLFASWPHVLLKRDDKKWWTLQDTQFIGHVVASGKAFNAVVESLYLE